VKRLIRQKRFILSILLIISLITFSYLKQRGLIAPDEIFAFLKNYPTLAPALFILLYVLLSVMLVPTLPLNLGAGFLWGTIWGTCFSVIGATLGAVGSFLVARYYFRHEVKHPAWLWLRDEIEGNGWKAIAFIRINPILSIGPVNYLLGITSVPLITYFWATGLFLIPPSALVSSIGNSMGDLALKGTAYSLPQNILIIAISVTLIVFTKPLMKKISANSKNV
jgi:uncharacterized membrane protein YdjX (TVP38/TMEM64 family)